MNVFWQNFRHVRKQAAGLSHRERRNLFDALRLGPVGYALVVLTS